MVKTMDALKRDLANIRSMRASPSMLDHIQVEYYGSPTPLKQLVSINILESRTLLISPFDKSSLGDIEKALLKSNIGITPQSDGGVIRLVMPELSQERRQELVKQVGSRLEDTRVSLRNIRRDTNEDIKKLKSDRISEDEIKSRQDDVQKMTDSYIKECEKFASQKKESILII